jgi:hypothetical protein
LLCGLNGQSRAQRDCLTAELVRVDPEASNQRERTSLPHLLS